MQELFERGGLELLSAFVAVAELGSFVAAADKLGRDASVLSRRVTELERQLGVRLLARTTRRISLTDVGSAYSSAFAGCWMNWRAPALRRATKRRGRRASSRYRCR